MKLFGAIFLAFGISQCATIKFEKNPPFVIKSATHVTIVGGIPGASSIKLYIDFTAKKKIDFQELFFVDKKTSAKIENGKKGQLLVGKFNIATLNNLDDFQLTGDPRGEFGNKPPVKKEKIPFELKKNEAVISYKDNGKIKYYKIKNLKQGESIYMQ